MDEAKAHKLALAEMRKWGLLDGAKPWKFAFNNRRRALGLCSPRVRTIYLSKYFLDKVSEVETLDTIRHEIAHALEWVRHGTSGHKAPWKAIAREVGAKPVRAYRGKVTHAYPYAIMFDGQIIRGMFRVPSGLSERVPNMMIPGRPETKGKLQLCRLTYN